MEFRMGEEYQSKITYNSVINYKNLVQEFKGRGKDVTTLDFEMIDNVFVYIKKWKLKCLF